MSACAGSLTEGFEAKRPKPGFTSCVSPELSAERKRTKIELLAGQVRMDLEPGRTRVHEHAETGKPPHPNDEDQSLGIPKPLET
jgi:hypothetical protein